jgi:hypothetical protein
VGTPVPLVFTVTNAGSASVTLQLLGRVPSADFRVSDTHGRMIWTRLRGQTMLGALRLYALGAEKALVFRDIWNSVDDAGNEVPPGDYLIRGVLLTDDPEGLASSDVLVRIGP